ncbi:MAG: DUF58 domain-containing protein [Opitutaceae bacterium]|nr:DUF58 domain-containing protein [Opitutaceae bacterium]
MNAAAVSFSPRRGALAAAARWRLPFSRQAWRGLAGNWIGAGAGSSLDFQDHRSYVPGDDPRHIHWQAFARTGALTMKLYRAEVAPAVDLLVDVSASMSFTPEKQARTDELLAFCVECADRAGAPVRLHGAEGRTIYPLATEEVRADRWRDRLRRSESESEREKGRTRTNAVPPSPSLPHSPSLSLSIPWRMGAMKVLISDLLFPGDPSALLVPLAAASGVGVVLAPSLAEEADLPWRGNIQLADCETNATRRQRVDDSLASRYRVAYHRHFALWREACRRRGILFARVPCAGTLAAALAHEAFGAGAVEAVA